MTLSVSASDYRFSLSLAPIGLQMLLIAFGAVVLVPLLTGLDSRVALFTAGLGTLVFQAVTKGRIPVFLGSSFAFIAPIVGGIEAWGVAETMGGLIAAGALYVLLSFLVRSQGVETMERFLPPIVTGPVIMVIGLMLAPVAINLSLGKTGDGGAVLHEEWLALMVSMATLLVTLIISIWGRNYVKLFPVLIGIFVGYVFSLSLGIVDFTPLHSSEWVAFPSFVVPKWRWEAIVYLMPVAIAPAIEHVGDIAAIGSVTGRSYFKQPGLHKTLLGDGLATMLAGSLGGPPNTTYSEVTGGVLLTKSFNPAIMTWAAVFAIGLSFFAKFGALLQTIPTPVIGGVLIPLFGAITVVGINGLVRSGEDLLKPRNLLIVSIILIFGVGGMHIGTAAVMLKGVGLASLIGVALNLVLPD